MESLGVIQFWTFLAGVIVIILMPGPNSLFVLKTSIVQGPETCLVCACRCTVRRCDFDFIVLPWPGLCVIGLTRVIPLDTLLRCCLFTVYRRTNFIKFASI